MVAPAVPALIDWPDPVIVMPGASGAAGSPPRRSANRPQTLFRRARCKYCVRAGAARAVSRDRRPDALPIELLTRDIIESL